MTARTRIAVVGGGQNCEHEVGLATAESVRRALDWRRYDVVPLTIARDGGWLLDGARTTFAGAMGVVAACDVVFPAVHGPRGEDGTLAAMCELAGVPYVGSGVRAGALAMDKWATKLVAAELGVGVAPGVLVSSPADGVPVDLPAVVKPVAAGSSHGVALVRSQAELGPAIAAALELDGRVLVEELVVGREVDVAVLERADGTRVVAPALEVVVRPGALFDTTAKYDGSADFRIPAAVSDVERKELEAAALAVFDALGCSGVARIDFFVTAHGLVLNEVNTMPGMTEQSQVPKMFAAAGTAYPTLLDELIAGALARHR
ncbi:D-alanine--D-alanine ligase family protein [Motilibacter deserti]|uniref:D-alanine--D-alanine ligase n=1 Tax=Motilibacter deserti TaxID=2714956 RepID=A0ABX0GSG1_9ACTN|nr:D-alanine--D-alanine ligase family protein [Motilibacter deserti]NHC13702.1 D-alanine--D-alanine ligase [Motilibacter deserti]